MYKLVVLFGKENSGKSTTLKALVSSLMQNKDFSLLYQKTIFSSDILAIFNYNNIKIGISSAGDNLEAIDIVEDILIKEYKCNFIFTAARTKGETIEKLESLKQDNLSYINKLYRTYDPISSIKEDLSELLFNQTNKIDLNYLKHYLELLLEGNK